MAQVKIAAKFQKLMISKALGKAKTNVSALKHGL